METMEPNNESNTDQRTVAMTIQEYNCLEALLGELHYNHSLPEDVVKYIEGLRPLYFRYDEAE